MNPQQSAPGGHQLYFGSVTPRTPLGQTQQRSLNQLSSQLAKEVKTTTYEAPPPPQSGLGFQEEGVPHFTPPKKPPQQGEERSGLTELARNR